MTDALCLVCNDSGLDPRTPEEPCACCHRLRTRLAELEAEYERLRGEHRKDLEEICELIDYRLRKVRGTTE